MKILILSDANSVHTYRWAKSLQGKGIHIEIFSLYQYEKEFSPSYKSLGINICIVKNYASHLGFKDEDYSKEGVEILDNNKDVILKSNLIYIII